MFYVLLPSSCQVPYCSVAMLEEVVDEEDTCAIMQVCRDHIARDGDGDGDGEMETRGQHLTMMPLQAMESAGSRLGGRSSPGGMSSMSSMSMMSSMSRSTIRTPAPPPKVPGDIWPVMIAAW